MKASHTSATLLSPRSWLKFSQSLSLLLRPLPLRSFRPSGYQVRLTKLARIGYYNCSAPLAQASAFTVWVSLSSFTHNWRATYRENASVRTYLNSSNFRAVFMRFRLHSISMRRTWYSNSFSSGCCTNTEMEVAILRKQSPRNSSRS